MKQPVATNKSSHFFLFLVKTKHYFNCVLLYFVIFGEVNTF